MRSGFVNQVEYLAQQASFPYWYAQCNRDLGPFAQMGNGLLSRIEPTSLEDHKLPGAIPGRGALVLRMPFSGSTATGGLDEELLVVLLHLSIGRRSQDLQLAYVGELIQGEKNVVVLGDLNRPLSTLLDASPLAGIGLRSSPSACPTYPSWNPSRIIDHALVSDSLVLQQYEVLECELSDHRPLAVTVARCPDYVAPSASQGEHVASATI